MSRLFLSLLVFTAGGGSSGLASRMPPTAQAFTQAPRKHNLPAHIQLVVATRRQHLSTKTLPSSVENPLQMQNSDDEAKTNAPDLQKFLVPFTALVSLSLTTLAAFTHQLPGPLIDATAPPPFFATLPFGVFFSGSFDPYTTPLIYQDVVSTLICSIGAGIFVKSITYPAKLGILKPRDSRKLIHTLSVPLFVLFWPLFSNAYGARVFASIVPLINGLRLYMAGTGGKSEEQSVSVNGSGNSMIGSESDLAGAISRSGDANEALGGPFIYCLILLFFTLFFWTDSPIGIVAIATMALGDGLADLVGRRLGSSNKWFFNKDKSMAGSAAFVAGSFVGSYSLLSWLISNGAMDSLELSPTGLAGRLLAIATICAGVELIPIADDNWTVPLSAGLLAAVLLH